LEKFAPEQWRQAERRSTSERRQPNEHHGFEVTTNNPTGGDISPLGVVSSPFF